MSQYQPQIGGLFAQPPRGPAFLDASHRRGQIDTTEPYDGHVSQTDCRVLEAERSLRRRLRTPCC